MLEVIRWQYLKIKFQNPKRIPVLQTGKLKRPVSPSALNATNLNSAIKPAKNADITTASKLLLLKTRATKSSSVS